MKICDRTHTINVFREAISWISDYRKNVPLTTPCGVAYDNVGILNRTATNILANRQSCLLPNFCKVLKMHGLAMAFEGDNGILQDIGDGYKLPKEMTTYMREKALRSEKDMSYNQIKRQMIKLLDIDKNSLHKVLNNAEVTTNTCLQFRTLLIILYSIDMHIWIYSTTYADQKYRII